MNRAEREAWIDQLHAENAESLLAIAQRAERSVELEIQECDALLARCAQRRQQAEKPADVIYKDFPAARQLAPPEPPQPSFSLLTQYPWLSDLTALIGDETHKALAEMRDKLRAELGELRAEVELMRSLAKSHGKTRKRG
jgi:hypothetical protein